MHNQSENVVTAEQYGLLERKFFQSQSLQETKECLSKMFFDVMCSDICDDKGYRVDIVSTVETLTAILTTIENKQDLVIIWLTSIYANL
jgi:hypothetical protein